MFHSLKEHWPEYFCEATELGLFMISAALFTMLLWHPSSPVLNLIPDPFVRRMLMGMAMGGTAIALVFSPLGKRSGAHFNPAVTLTFWRLGKVKNWDAFFYVIAQFIGGIAGMFVVALVARMTLSHPAVNYVATLPGPHGMTIAFIAELIIAFILMTVVLNVSNTPYLARFTGMSMNPARTFSSAFVGHLWTGLWIYFIAPVLAMQLAATLYLRSKRPVYCAKDHHHNNQRCIFNCRFSELLEREQASKEPYQATTTLNENSMAH